MKNLTADEKLLLSAVLSFIGSAASGAISAGYQQWSTGTINPGVVLNVVILAFITLIGKSLYDYVPTHITQELQALRDFQLQVFTRPPVVVPVAQPVQPQQPLVIIHTQGASVEPATNDTVKRAIPVPTSANIVPRAQPVPMPLRETAQSYQSPAQPVALAQATPDDVLGDLPDSPMETATKITGVIPVYGASGK